jgi:hypothetical protein
MPFDNDKPWAFNRETIESFNAGQTGVYAIYNAQQWIYIGQGDIRRCLLNHFGGDIATIAVHSPTHFRFEVTADSNNRERQLLREYAPVCNSRLS